MLGGDIMFLFLFLVSHVLHWLLIYIMRLFMINQEFILFLLVFFTHAFMCLLSVTGIYRLIQSCYCLHWQLIDSS